MRNFICINKKFGLKIYMVIRKIRLKKFGSPYDFFGSQTQNEVPAYELGQYLLESQDVVSSTLHTSKSDVTDVIIASRC